MGWLIVLGVLIVLAWIPLELRLQYDADGPEAAARIAGIPIRLYPRSKKKRRKPQMQPKVDRKNETIKGEMTASDLQPQVAPGPEHPRAQNGEEQPKVASETAEKAPASGKTAAPAPAPQPAPKKKGGSLTDFLPLAKLGLELLGDFRRKLRVNRLDFKAILAGSDPCNLAVNYGRAWAAIGNLLPRLERYFVIRKRNIEVECDFVGSETLIEARMDLSITLGRGLLLAAVYGVRGLKVLLNLKKRKGGAQV